LRLWRLITADGAAVRRIGLTPQRRHRLALALRARRWAPCWRVYRVIAAGLFGEVLVPAGPAGRRMTCATKLFVWCALAMELMQGGYLDLLRA